jgi:3-oxoacyl-[acyl-carrier-protein] synthase II
MPSSPHRAVLTGLGLVNPLGLDRASVWDALLARRSGVRRIQAYDPSALPVQIGAEVLNFEPREHIEKKDRKRLSMMARSTHLAVVAARFAMQDAQATAFEPTRFGVVFGAATMPSDMSELGPASAACAGSTPPVDLDAWADKGLPLVPPAFMLMFIPNMMSCHVAILNNAQGPTNTITMTDAAGLLALGEAYRTVQRGKADVFLVGGADSRVMFVNLARHCLFNRLSRRNDAPEQASRPFDRQRDGMVLGEGAGVLVLEELEHAQRRGAPILAEVVGFGAGFDRDRSGAGLARAIRAALTEAGIGLGDVDHINAHGAGAIEEDAWEARGLRQVFGATCPPIFAAKSYFGHLGAGGASSELAIGLLALKHGILPATLNFQEPDPACPVSVSAEERPITRPCFLKISLTDMGQCAAVVCRKAPGS